MKARFIGDPGDGFSGPETLTVFGVEFVKGEWAEVRDKRFGSHSHFEFDADENGEPDPSVDKMKADLDELGVKYRANASPAKLAELLEAATAPSPEGKEEGA
jgi:hypothetical protein